AFKTIALFALFFVLMPFTFLFQAQRNWDKWIGDLSYPIYICHMLVIVIVEYFLVKFGIKHKGVVVSCIVICTILFSICLINLIAQPIESIRKRFRSSNILPVPRKEGLAPSTDEPLKL